MGLKNEAYDSMDDYLEALSVNREIEFVYKGSGYRFEPNFEKGGYNVWKYVDGFRTGGGVIIAYVATPEKALAEKCFDGSSFAEIEAEATDKYIF